MELVPVIPPNPLDVLRAVDTYVQVAYASQPLPLTVQSRRRPRVPHTLMVVTAACCCQKSPSPKVRASAAARADACARV